MLSKLICILLAFQLIRYTTACVQYESYLDISGRMRGTFKDQGNLLCQAFGDRATSTGSFIWYCNPDSYSVTVSNGGTHIHYTYPGHSYEIEADCIPDSRGNRTCRVWAFCGWHIGPSSGKRNDGRVTDV